MQSGEERGDSPEKDTYAAFSAHLCHPGGQLEESRMGKVFYEPLHSTDVMSH